MPTDDGDRSTARGTVKLAIAHVVMAACGIATHIYLTRALQPQLYGLLAVVLVASYLPGRRATRLDPAQALKAE